MTAPQPPASHTSPGAVTAAARMQRLATNPADFIAPPRVTRKEVKVLEEGPSTAMLRAAEGRRSLGIGSRSNTGHLNVTLCYPP